MTAGLPGDPIHPGDALSKLARQRLENTSEEPVARLSWPLAGEWFVQLPHATAPGGSVIVRVSVTSQYRCQFSDGTADRLSDALTGALDEVSTWQP